MKNALSCFSCFRNITSFLLAAVILKQVLCCFPLSHTYSIIAVYRYDPNFIGLHQSFGIFSRVKTCWFPINLYGKQNVICLKLALNTGVYMSLVKLHQMFVVFKIHETNFTHGL